MTVSADDMLYPHSGHGVLSKFKTRAATTDFCEPCTTSISNPFASLQVSVTVRQRPIGVFGRVRRFAARAVRMASPYVAHLAVSWLAHSTGLVAVQVVGRTLHVCCSSRVLAPPLGFLGAAFSGSCAGFVSQLFHRAVVANQNVLAVPLCDNSTAEELVLDAFLGVVFLKSFGGKFAGLLPCHLLRPGAIAVGSDDSLVAGCLQTSCVLHKCPCCGQCFEFRCLTTHLAKHYVPHPLPSMALFMTGLLVGLRHYAPPLRLRSRNSCGDSITLINDSVNYIPAQISETGLQEVYFNSTKCSNVLPIDTDDMPKYLTQAFTGRKKRPGSQAVDLRKPESYHSCDVSSAFDGCADRVHFLLAPFYAPEI